MEALARRAMDAAVFAAELTALCASQRSLQRGQLALRALRSVREPMLYAALEEAVLRAGCECDPQVHAHSAEHADSDALIRMLALSTYAFVRAGACPLEALMVVLRAGGDSEGAGAIVMGWVNMLHADSTVARTQAA